MNYAITGIIGGYYRSYLILSISPRLQSFIDWAPSVDTETILLKEAGDLKSTEYKAFF